MDESGLFYFQIKAKSLILAGDPYKEGKGQKNKECITIIFHCSAMGEDEDDSYQKIQHIHTPSEAKRTSYPSATTTTRIGGPLSLSLRLTSAGITTSSLHKICHVLLFTDNAPGHPDIQLSNIKLEFLPPNTTSKLQAHDAGIFTQVKAIYLKHMLNNILLNIMNDTKAVDAAKNTELYTAVEWLSLAWEGVSNLNIQQCYNKVGLK